MMSTKFSDFLTPPCLHLDLIYILKFMQPPFLHPLSMTMQTSYLEDPSDVASKVSDGASAVDFPERVRLHLQTGELRNCHNKFPVFFSAAFLQRDSRKI